MFGSGSGVVKGADWQYEVFLDLCADGVGEEHYIPAASLYDDMREKIDVNQNILNIWLYKESLTELQLTQKHLHHQFVVLQTGAQCWWSVEKDGRYIVIRRSDRLEVVRDNDKRGERIKPIVKMRSGVGAGSMGDLIDFLFDNDELWKTYHVTKENCQDFATRVFNKLVAA